MTKCCTNSWEKFDSVVKNAPKRLKKTVTIRLICHCFGACVVPEAVYRDLEKSPLILKKH